MVEATQESGQPPLWTQKLDITVMESSVLIRLTRPKDGRGTQTVAIFNIIIEDELQILSLERYIADFVDFDRKVRSYFKKSKISLPSLREPLDKEARRRSIKNIFSLSGASKKSNAVKIEYYLRKCCSDPYLRDSWLLRDFLAVQRNEDRAMPKNAVDALVNHYVALNAAQGSPQSPTSVVSFRPLSPPLTSTPDTSSNDSIISGLRPDLAPRSKSVPLRDQSDEDVNVVPNDNELASYHSRRLTAPRAQSVSALPHAVQRPKKTLQDFQLLKVLGKGCMGKVLLVKEHKSDKLFALKAISKSWVVMQREIEHTKAERDILARVAAIKHPFLMRLHYSFQSPSQLFLVMDYYVGGDIATQLARYRKFSIEQTRFYAAEILVGLEELHRLQIVYRDLKPENILLTASGHIVLTDFGLSKQFVASDESDVIDSDLEISHRTNTFCGTAEYLAPEILQGMEYSFAVDFWSLGTLLYEMITGVTPFWADNHGEMYRRVLQDDLVFPQGFDYTAADMIDGLLQRVPSYRLGWGYDGIEELKSHLFFHGLNWNDVLERRLVPPYVPNLQSSTDFSNFDDTFLNMPTRISLATTTDTPTSTYSTDMFDGYSFTSRSVRNSIIEDSLSDDESEDSGMSHQQSLEEWIQQDFPTLSLPLVNEDSSMTPSSKRHTVDLGSFQATPRSNMSPVTPSAKRRSAMSPPLNRVRDLSVGDTERKPLSLVPVSAYDALVSSPNLQAKPCTNTSPRTTKALSFRPAPSTRTTVASDPTSRSKAVSPTDTKRADRHPTSRKSMDGAPFREDYREEQQNELEALQSIYPDEFEELDPNEFRIRVNPEEESEDYPFVLSLKVTYTPTYPDELPDFSVEVIQGDVPPTAMDRFKSELTRVGEESLGMAMCFALASALKEELEALILRLRKERDDEREERLRKELEAEQEKFRGTRVTRQKFLDWKKAFDKEMAEKEVAERGRIKVVAGKLTGRQLFEQDKSLASSDATYMEEGDDSVDVSLFEKEDIELSDEEEDDNAVWKSFKGED